MKSPPRTKRAARLATGDPSYNATPNENNSTPWRVVIRDKSRIGREIVWNRFCTRAGALAEARALHGSGIEHARVEGPTL